MASITCGKCKSTHNSVDDVRACFKGEPTPPAEVPIPAEAFQPPSVFAAMSLVPSSKYALEDEQGKVTFYEVKRPTSGKWKGWTFVDRLVGAPGAFTRYSVKGAQKALALAMIGEDPKAAARKFSMTFTVCACCGSPLSDPESLATGFGPICGKRFVA